MRKKYDLAKETVTFLRHTDYTRLRDFNLKIVMVLIQKPNRSELITKLKGMTRKNNPTHLMPKNHHRNDYRLRGIC